MKNIQVKSTSKAILYIVATPIGNREDITIRALNTLFLVDIILCEDTRKTYQLLKNYQTNYKNENNNKIPQLESFFQGNENKKIDQVINCLNQNKQIALVSNSGTPLISDPGFKLIRECIKKNIAVTSLPGPCAAITGLSMSGMPTDKFLFLGFLPLKTSKRNRIFENIKTIKKTLNPTIIVYESPYRIIKTLNNIKEHFGDIEICLVREITKKFEQIHKDNLTNIVKYYGTKKIKGELIIFF